MTTTTSKVCKHEDFTLNRAEPDVGIMTAYFECNDCGVVTTEYDTDNDYDRDEDGYVYGGEWTVPVWPECEHATYYRQFDRWGNTTWICEDCGATTDETETDEHEDGHGKVETPLWD